MRKNIKELLDPELINKWRNEGELNGYHFDKGDLVCRKDAEGESLGIFLEQDGVFATIQWTKEPKHVKLLRKNFVSDIKLISGISK